MKCHKCEKEMNVMTASCGTGDTWSLFVCRYCGWKHYSGWLFPCDSIWQDAKDGKASIDFGPHHQIKMNVCIGENAGKTQTYMDGYPTNYRAGYVCGYCGKSLPNIDMPTGTFHSFVVCIDCWEIKHPEDAERISWQCLKCSKYYNMDGTGYSNPSLCPECTGGLK